MIDLEQEVTIKWFTRNKKRFIDLGYKFTNISDTFSVKVKHLEKNSNVKVMVQCDGCGKSMITPYRNYNKIINYKGTYNCRKCNASYVSEIRINNNKERLLDDFYEMINKIGCKPIATIKDCNGCNIPMPFICPIHGEQKLSTNQLRQGCICPKCGKENKRKFNMIKTNELINIISSKNNNRILNPEDYINANTNNLKIECGSCKNIFITSLSSLRISGGHCKECGKIAQSKTARFKINELIEQTTINNICYLLNPEDYKRADKRNLLFKCLTCDNTFKRSLSHYKNGDNRCSICTRKMSKGEYKIKEVLDSLNIDYIQEKRFKDCKDIKTLPFDFYLPYYNICIEFDGWQHYNMTKHDTSEKFEIRKKHDIIKDEYCKNNNMYLIRIPYWEYKNIDNILHTEINKCKLEDIV